MAAAPAAPVRARLAPALRLTQVTTHPVAPAAPSFAKLWGVPRDSPILTSLSFLGRSTPAAPGLVEVESIELGSIVLAALKYDSLAAADTAALAGANLVEDELSRAVVNDILQELYQARIFEGTYDNIDAFLSAVCGSTLVQSATMSFTAGMVSRGAPYDLPGVPGRAARGRHGRAGHAPAVPAVPAVPGPTELKFLQRVTWFAMIQKGREVDSNNPGILLSMATAMVSSCDRDATRRDDGSRCRLFAATVDAYIRDALRLDPRGGDALLASKLPIYFARIFSVLPSVLRAHGRSNAEMDADLRDSHSLLVGKGAEVAFVYWSRIHERLSMFEVLSHFQGQTLGVSDTRSLLERLATKFVTSTSSHDLPLVRVMEIDSALVTAEKSEVVADLFSAGSTASEVVSELLGARGTLGSTGTLNAGDACYSSGVDGSGVPAASGSVGGALSAAALERSFNSAFSATVDEADGLSGLDLLDKVCSSGAVIVLRYLYFAAPFLTTKHELFGRMAQAMPERREHLSACVTTDPSTGNVPDKYGTYRISVSADTFFWSLQWTKMDMVNHSMDDPAVGGFLSLRHLDNACVFGQVPEADWYVVEVCLVGVRSWFTRLLLGGGFSAAPTSGYTWEQVVDEQIELIRYIQGLPADERPSWIAWARANFLEQALGRAATHAEVILKSSEPAREEFGPFLPDGAAFFTNITRRLREAEPVAAVRRAFPNFMPATPIALPGTSTLASGTSTSAGTALHSGTGTGKEVAKRKPSNKPGGGVARMLKSGDLFLAGGTYDVDAIANKLKIDVHAKCWPVLFTNKTGKDRLQVCLDPEHHGGLDAEVHKSPPGFNRVQLSKDHSRAATSAERKEAGWVAAKQPRGK